MIKEIHGVCRSETGLITEITYALYACLLYFIKEYISLIYYIQKVYFERIGVGDDLLRSRGGDEKGLILGCFENG